MGYSLSGRIVEPYGFIVNSCDTNGTNILIYDVVEEKKERLTSGTG